MPPSSSATTGISKIDRSRSVYPAKRGVVAAASYEARRFRDFRSRDAFDGRDAKKVSRSSCSSRRGFDRLPGRLATDPMCDLQGLYTLGRAALSRRRAYLDVTDNLSGAATAWETAKEIRARILAETELTASAGVFLEQVPQRSSRPISASRTASSRSCPTEAEAFVGCASDREVSWRGSEDGMRQDARAWH